MTMHLTDDELVLHYYGEMREDAEARTCAHLEACAPCRENLGRLQRVMAAVDPAAAPEPDVFFEQRTWARLAPALAAAAPPRRRRLPWPAIAWGAAAALVVIAAFAAGRFFPAETTAPVGTAATGQDSVRDRVLLADLGDHLDRTEAALIEFVTGTDGRDMGSGRSRAEDLAAANRLYRRTAESTGDQGMADVLDQLERVLIEMAGFAPEASTGDLDAVRRRIDARGLLFKVRMMREQLEERAKETVRTRGQDTTI